MKVHIHDKHLLELYTTGKSRKLRVPADVAVQFVAAAGEVITATNIHDLWKTPKRKFEKLRGHPNRYSMRLTLKYRLEMEVEWTNDEKTIGEFTLVDVSNHYGD